MTQEQIGSLVRQILLAIGGALVAKGYTDSATMVQWVGIIMTVLTAAYGLYVRRRAGLITSAAAQPGVININVTPETEQSSAALASNPKVKS